MAGRMAGETSRRLGVHSPRHGARSPPRGPCAGGGEQLLLTGSRVLPLAVLAVLGAVAAERLEEARRLGRSDEVALAGERSAARARGVLVEDELPRERVERDRAEPREELGARERERLRLRERTR